MFGITVPHSHVSYSEEFEWREAAHWAHYTWEAFAALDGLEQSAIIAHYRGHHQLAAVIAHATRPKPPKGRKPGSR